MSKADTIEDRQSKEKATLLGNLKKMPIVHIACEKSNIGRATYYRWCTDDKEFRKQADEAIAEGEALITDMSESQLISLIKDRKFPAVQLWLRHHHPKYTNRIEIIEHAAQSDELTSEQKKVVQEALRLANLTESKTHHDTSKKS